MVVRVEMNKKGYVQIYSFGHDTYKIMCTYKIERNIEKEKLREFE